MVNVHVRKENMLVAPAEFASSFEELLDHEVGCAFFASRAAIYDKYFHKISSSIVVKYFDSISLRTNSPHIISDRITGSKRIFVVLLVFDAGLAFLVTGVWTRYSPSRLGLKLSFGGYLVQTPGLKNAIEKHIFFWKTYSLFYS